MDRASELAAEIRAWCEAHANPEQAARYARYFTEGYDAWGCGGKNPAWTAKQAEWLETYRGLGVRGFLKLGELLLAGGKYEEGGLAILFLAKYRDRMDAKSFQKLSRWFEAGIRNWGHTDVLCSEVIAPLLAEGRVGLDELAPWRESPLKYQRRAVPVGMLGLLKTTDGVPDLLNFLRPLMMDPERVVQQGLGWFLRESWKKSVRPVEAFLMEWKDRSPRLIFQYATERMAAGARGRFRRNGIH